MKILAVDYGDSRTGLAISDPSELLATPLKPQIEEKSMVKVAAKICEAAQANRAQKIVVGLPRNMDGTEGARAQKSRKLAAIVEQQSGLPVRMWDERQTTITAAGILRDLWQKAQSHPGCSQRLGDPGKLSGMAQESPRRGGLSPSLPR